MSAFANMGLAGAEDRTAKMSRVFSLAIMVLFIVLLMCALLAGVNVYRALNAAGDAANNQRQSLSLVANAIRANDAAEAVSLAPGPEGDALVLSEHVGSATYETRIYLYQGSIMQEYTQAGNAIDPAAATPIASSRELSFALQGNVVRVTCSEGDVAVTLRSQGGGSHG